MHLGNGNLEAEGASEKADGKAQKNIGKSQEHAEDVAKKATK